MSDVELEAALQAKLDAQTLGVYADALQAKNDPRGELISIDLHCDAHGSTPELEARRREHLVAWLGGEALSGRRWNPRRVRYGLVDDFDTPNLQIDNAAYFAHLLASPAADYLCGLTLITTERRIDDQLRALVARPRPWLRRLKIVNVGSKSLDRDLARALIDATPHLEVLYMEASHRFIPYRFEHPSLRKVVLRGRCIALEHDSWANVVEADFRNADYRSDEVVAKLPALTSIDLSREPTLRTAALESLPDRITRMRVRAPRDGTERARILELANARPHTQITLAEAYACYGAPMLAHPRVTVEDVRPWPPRDRISPDVYAARQIVIGDMRVSYRDIHLAMEQQFDKLDPDARAAWRQIWACLDQLERGAQQRQLSRATALAALEPLDDVVFIGLVGTWGDVVARLRASRDERITLHLHQ
jgi:hypothetical protein